MSERRARLREATADTHRVLDAQFGGIRARADYLSYVRMLTSFRSAIEERVAAPGPHSDHFRPTHLSDVLAEDLRDLGLKNVRPLSPCSIDCEGDAWLGVVYVLEGSTLGAPMIFRAAARFGFDETYGARHLARQIAARTSWKQFVSYLESRPSVDMARAITAANATFELALTAAKESREPQRLGSAERLAPAEQMD